MKFVTDFMGWMAHNGAPWRAYPQVAMERARPRPAMVQAARPRPAATWNLDRAREAPLAKMVDGLDHCDPRVNPREWLMAASRAAGIAIVKDGKPIGQIKDLSIDKRSGKIVYALAAFGGGRRATDRFHPLPWSLLKYDLENDGYVALFDISALAGAPSLTRDELQWFGAGDDAWREKLAAYYAPHMLTPYI